MKNLTSIKSIDELSDITWNKLDRLSQHYIYKFAPISDKDAISKALNVLGYKLIK